MSFNSVPVQVFPAIPFRGPPKAKISAAGNHNRYMNLAFGPMISMSKTGCFVLKSAPHLTGTPMSTGNWPGLVTDVLADFAKEEGDGSKNGSD